MLDTDKLIRLAIRLQPPLSPPWTPDGPVSAVDYQDPVHEPGRVSFILSDHFGEHDSPEYRYALAVMHWLGAVRWRASQSSPERDAIPHAEWKLVYRPWLESLTTGGLGGFEGWKLLIAYYNRIERRESTADLLDTFDPARF